MVSTQGSRSTMACAELALRERAEDLDRSMEIAGEELDVAEHRLALLILELVGRAIGDRVRPPGGRPRLVEQSASASAHAATHSSIPGYCSSPVCWAIFRPAAACLASAPAGRPTTRR